ncbi:MAG: NTP transferase domain-containing protein [Deltaproteobacteria bacterium]|nr:NTP transferase domain-containing protein [Deltaproteobacteria bacterium]MBN2672317.1 NTP transferase domain-containing protein [Deltaproteobacteria bacterium]
MNEDKPSIVVIIAAGMGSRLTTEDSLPKPLMQVNGRALILRVLDRFYEAGVTEAVIVTGHRADEIESGVSDAQPQTRVRFVRNPNYKMSNGLSVLAAKSAVGNRNFFLSMADHIFESSLISGLKDAPLPDDGLVLAVDRKLDAIYDEDDATKVKTADGKIVEIHKELTEFDAVDTGLFLCTPALFDRISEAAGARDNGDCSLSDGVKAMSLSGTAIVHDIGNGKWQDVDTPGAIDHAARLF